MKTHDEVEIHVNIIEAGRRINIIQIQCCWKVVQFFCWLAYESAASSCKR